MDLATKIELGGQKSMQFTKWYEGRMLKQFIGLGELRKCVRAFGQGLLKVTCLMVLDGRSWVMARWRSLVYILEGYEDNLK